MPTAPTSMNHHARYGKPVKKQDSWGPAVAALVLGLLAIIVVVAFYFGIRGLI